MRENGRTLTQHCRGRAWKRVTCKSWKKRIFLCCQINDICFPSHFLFLLIAFIAMISIIVFVSNHSQILPDPNIEKSLDNSFSQGGCLQIRTTYLLYFSSMVQEIIGMFRDPIVGQWIRRYGTGATLVKHDDGFELPSPPFDCPYRKFVSKLERQGRLYRSIVVLDAPVALLNLAYMGTWADWMVWRSIDYLQCLYYSSFLTESLTWWIG